MKLATAISAFSSRGMHGKKAVLLLYSAIATVVIVVLSSMISAQAVNVSDPINPYALADMFAMMAMGLALFVIAPAMVASQVGEERRAGTLDLLRTAPLSPTALVVGFLAGAPGSLYLLLAGPLALHCAVGLAGIYPIAILPMSLAVLALGSVTLMIAAMIASLALGRTAGGGAAPMIVVAALGVASMMATALASSVDTAPWAFVHPAGTLAVLYDQFGGPFRSMNLSSWQVERMTESGTQAWLGVEAIFALFMYAASASILLVSARRSLAGEPPAQLTKLEALGLFGVAVVALLVPYVPAPRLTEDEPQGLCAMAILLVTPYVLLVLGATPTARGWGDGRAPRLSARGAPLAVAMLMMLLAVVVARILFGSVVFEIITDDRYAPAILAFVGVAVTIPIYALFAMTRIATAPGRLAFGAVIAVHLALQIPTWVIWCESLVHRDYYREPDAALPLAHVGMLVGVLLPLVVAWRQRVGDMRARAV